MIHESATIVRADVASLHQEAFPLLIRRLSDLLSSGDGVVGGNASGYLVVLASLKEPHIRSALQRQFLVPRAADSTVYHAVLGSITVDPSLLFDLDPAPQLQIRGVLSSRILATDGEQPTYLSHPIQVTAALLKECGEDGYFAKFMSEFQPLIERFVTTSFLAITLAPFPKAIGFLFTVVCGKAASVNFAESNAVCVELHKLDSAYSFAFSPQQCYLLLLNVCIGARRGALGAQDLTQTRFLTLPSLREKALAFVAENEGAARDRYEFTLIGESFEDVLRRYFRTEDEGGDPFFNLSPEALSRYEF